MSHRDVKAIIWLSSQRHASFTMATEAKSVPVDDTTPSTVTVTVTAHEAKLLQALRSEPNRVAMWVSRGDPMRNHKDLLDMYAVLLNFLHAHKVEYWLEYGSVLGYKQHGGMIPWEWDAES